MSEELFTEQLRRFTRQRPFVPFVVEFKDGRRITVDRPDMGFGGGAAGFISEEEGLVSFRFEDVTAMRHLTPEAAS